MGHIAIRDIQTGTVGVDAVVLPEVPRRWSLECHWKQ